MITSFFEMLGSRRLIHSRGTVKALAVAAVVMMFAGLHTAAAAEKMTLNLKGADIMAVIGTVADLTGKNFIVDPRVKGKVTIISSQPMTKEQVYQVFLSVLEVHGYTAVPAGRVVKILPDADAKHSGLPTVDDDELKRTDETVTQVIQVNHVSAAQLVPLLRPLVPPQGHLAAHPQTNTLIVSDRANNIRRLLDIIKRMDQPSGGEIETITLKYASAAEVVRIFNALQQQTKKGDPKAGGPEVVADERTNSVLIVGERAERSQVIAIINKLDTPTEITGNTHVVYLRYAKAKDLAPVLKDVGDIQAKDKQGGAQVKAKPEGDISIQAEESTNALVITAPPDSFRSLQAVIQQLDVPRAQVLVEAIITEISSDKAAELGMQWLFNESSGDSPIGAIDFGTKDRAGISSIAAAVAGGLPPTPPTGVTLAGGKLFPDGSLNFAGLLTAMAGDSSINVLSTPSIVTMDNQEATISVGEQVSIPSGSYTSTSATGSATPANPFTTFQREKVGIELKVKPQINEGSAIKLEIEQKVNDIKDGSAGQSDLVTNNREIKTTVMVDDGGVLVLGGLIQDRLLESVAKVPLLGDLPLLGYLFRYQETKKTKTNLVVFLHPKILRTGEDAIRLTSSKYNYIRDQQIKKRKDGVALMLDRESPVLPTMEELLKMPPEESAEKLKSLMKQDSK